MPTTSGNINLSDDLVLSSLLNGAAQSVSPRSAQTVQMYTLSLHDALPILGYSASTIGCCFNLTLQDANGNTVGGQALGDAGTSGDWNVPKIGRAHVCTTVTQ